MAGANSIFYGEKLLTTKNVQMNEDLQLLRDIGAEAFIPAPDTPTSSSV